MRHSIPLQGKPGDLFNLVIDDDMSSFWNADTGKDAVVRVKLVPGSQFARGFPLFFKLKVPRGTKAFTVCAKASHPGYYGVILVDGTGKIIAFENRKNTLTLSPGLKNISRGTGDFLTIPVLFRLEQTFSLLTWSGRYRAKPRGSHPTWNILQNDTRPWQQPYKISYFLPNFLFL